MKLLTVIASTGFIMFVSQTYGGMASDKFIVRNSGVEDYLRRGDEVMADKGFKQDVLGADGDQGEHTGIHKR